jgi:hypothetical protein
MRVKLENILPNPFRDLERNPLVPIKIEELRASIRQTGYWDNVVVRQRKDGKFELAYGHHRLEAAKLEGITEADFIVKDFDDATMIKVMSAENNDAYGYTILSLIEVVRAAVNALADGRIPTFEIPKDTKKEYIRYAPSFSSGGKAPAANFAARPYTAVALADFLGYTRKDGRGRIQADTNIQAALRALELIQEGVYTENTLKDWKVAQLLKNTQDRWDMLQRQREQAAKKKEDEAERLRIEQRRKAEQEEREAIIEESRKKKAEAERKRREAEAAENAKAVAQAEERRAKLEEEEKLRLLKAHKTAVRKALDKYTSAISVTEGVAIEKAVKQAEEILESKDSTAAVKLTEQLSTLSRKVTDKYLEQQKVEQESAERERKELAVRNMVKALYQKIERIMSEEDPLREVIKSAARNPEVNLKERDLLHRAMKDAAERVNQWAGKFAKAGKVDVLAEAYKKEDAKRKLDVKEEEVPVIEKEITTKKASAVKPKEKKGKK